jgi:Cu(I)/Ag(I) efflux system membrane fusion protein
MKDETLVSFYSPEFVAFQQAYLYAVAALERLGASGATASPEQLALTRANVQAAKDRLSALGMGAAQIEEIGRSHQFAQQVLLRAPDTSFVIARNVSPGQRFDRGTELYRLADLTQVWILADLFEGEAAYFRPGVRARVSLPPQRKVLYARVSPVLPQIDPATRSLKIRLNADNPGFVLRPDMFVDVDLPVTLTPTIAVPVDAVLDSGLARTVFVEHRPGVFEPRQVETGWRFGDRVEIVRGLAPGERIVTSGTFLIDSEARMKLGSPAAPTPSQAGPAASSAGQALAPAPPPHHHGAPAMPAHAIAPQGGAHAERRHD